MSPTTARKATAKSRRRAATATTSRHPTAASLAAADTLVRSLADAATVNLEAREATGIPMAPRSALRIRDLIGDIEKMELATGLEIPIFSLRRFNAAAFVDRVAMRLSASGLGFAIQVNRNGRLVAKAASGWARTPADGELKWSSDTRLHLASSSKFFNAVALVKLLEDRSISVHRRVRDFLPSHWKIGPKAQNLTFHHLLTHQAGNWKEEHANYDGLKRAIATEAQPITDHPYHNINYALFSILIPILSGRMRRNYAPPFYPGSVGEAFRDIAWSAETRRHFTDYVNANVFQPAGVILTSLKSNAQLSRILPFSQIPQYANVALAYPYPPTKATTRGADISRDENRHAGAVGWHLSCNEILAVLDHVRRRNNIISRPTLDRMLTNGYGIRLRHVNRYGALAGHGGSWAGDARGQKAWVGYIGNSHEVAVLSNNEIAKDNHPTLPQLQDVIVQAYDASVS